MRRPLTDRRGLALALVALSFLACDLRPDRERFRDACGVPSEPIQTGRPERFDVAFRDSGRLAVIWRWGRTHPWHDGAIAVSDAAGTRVLEIDRADWLQWIDAERLFYQRTPRDESEARGGPFIVDLQGRIVRDFDAPARLQGPVVSPDRRWIANTHWDERGNGTFEVLPFEGPLDPIGARSNLSHPVWSPDSTQLAASRITLPSGVPRGIYHRELLVPRDLSSETPLHENREGDALGYNELGADWWAPDGIYGLGKGVLQRCDPEGAGCVELYRPAVEGSLRDVTPGPDGVAYLLVNEEDPCFLEPGAREIHRLELATGRTDRLLRTPDGVLLDEIDWVDVPDAEPPVESPAASRKER